MEKGLFDELNDSGGSAGMAILELPAGMSVGLMEEIDPAKLFRGLKVVVTEIENRGTPIRVDPATGETLAISMRSAIRVRLFHPIKTT